MDWSALTESLGGFYSRWSGVIYVFFIILAVLIVNRILHWVLSAIVKRKHPVRHVWRDAFLGALGPPLRAIVWVIGLTVAASIFMRDGDVTMLSKLFPPARNVVAILAVAWFFLRVVGRAETNLHDRARSRGEPIDPTAADAIGKLVRAAIIITAALVVMQTLGFSIGGLLAFGGAAGIAVGFAAQTLVANLLGGLTVFASRIFRIGDDIILPGTTLAGTVRHIGWRATRVVGWDGKPFYVPNSYFNSSNLVNHSRLEHRSFSEDLLLRYRDFDKVEAIVRRGNELLAKRDDLAYFVFRFDSFGDAALKLNIYAWPKATSQAMFLPYAEFARIKEEVLLAMASIAIDEGCELVQPFSHVYLREEGPPDLRPDLPGPTPKPAAGAP
ncbi:MAG TPA: mechanosensitive ion channel family protein [Gammaproteobacteria bacterium]|nr:mechanosensitive ion channel family protein [Gammaproteobacteria bacterium]